MEAIEIADSQVLEKTRNRIGKRNRKPEPAESRLDHLFSQFDTLLPAGRPQPPPNRAPRSGSVPSTAVARLDPGLGLRFGLKSGLTTLRTNQGFSK